MKLVAAVYTLASVAVLTLMVMRPPVQISNTATTTTAATAPATVTNQAVNAPATPAAPIATPATDNTAPATPPATTNKPAPDAKAVPDYAREQRLASEISDAIMDGEVVSLNDGTQNFMGILTAAEQPRGAVIILHGRGYHPDWEDVAHPLRTGLAAKGWTTLSLQMPVLEKEAKYYDYVPLFANADKRIDAGIASLVSWPPRAAPAAPTRSRSAPLRRLKIQAAQALPRSASSRPTASAPPPHYSKSPPPESSYRKHRKHYTRFAEPQNELLGRRFHPDEGSRFAATRSGWRVTPFFSR